MPMYQPLERSQFQKCLHCGTQGNGNIERSESMTGDGKGNWISKKDALVFHCHACGCNTEV